MKNFCQYGHAKHDTIIIDTNIGKMTVYNWEKYKNQKNYCTGQDDVSRTLINTGIWEENITTRIKSILSSGNRKNIVIDIGSHIGWFSRIAIRSGYSVVSIESNQEHISNFKKNMDATLKDWIVIYNIKLGPAITPIDIEESKAELMKIDIEGDEIYALQTFQKWFEKGRIKNVIMEISPTFNKSYPGIVDNMRRWGYHVKFIDGKLFDYNWDFNQTNLWFHL